MNLAQFIVVSALVFTWIGVEAQETKNAPEDSEADTAECADRGKKCADMCSDETHCRKYWNSLQKKPDAGSRCCKGLSCEKHPDKYMGGFCAKDKDDVKGLCAK